LVARSEVLAAGESFSMSLLSRMPYGWHPGKLKSPYSQLSAPGVSPANALRANDPEKEILKKIVHVASTASTKHRGRIGHPASKGSKEDAIPMKPLVGVITVYLVVAGFTYNVFNCAMLGIPSDSFDLGRRTEGFARR
jgi:hypothetical protein